MLKEINREEHLSGHSPPENDVTLMSMTVQFPNMFTDDCVWDDVADAVSATVQTLRVQAAPHLWNNVFGW